MERGIGLGLLVGILWAFAPINRYVWNYILTKIGLGPLFYIPSWLFIIDWVLPLGIGLVIGIALGITFKRMKIQIKTWALRKKILLILISFNIVPICIIIYCRFTWCSNMEFAYLINYNICALLSIGLLAVYDKLKLRRLKTLDSR